MSFELWEFYLDNLDKLNKLGNEGYELQEVKENLAIFQKVDGKIEYFVDTILPICGKRYSEDSKSYKYENIIKVVSFNARHSSLSL